MTTSKPRLGFLGLGWIGRSRMESVLQSGAAEVAVLSDVEESALERALAIAPSARPARGLEELLDAAPDGIVIATPSAQHAEQALAALERGIAVFCQKPLGRNAEETRRVLRAAQAADRLLGVDLSYRHTLGMRTIRELVREGRLGQIYAADLVFHNAYGPDKAWFYERSLSGGGALIDLGTHMLDLALWVLDHPQVEDVRGRVFSRGVRLAASCDEVEDYAAAELSLASGAAIRLACSWKLHAGCDCVVEAAFYGTRGGVCFYNVGGSFYDFGVDLFDATSRRTLVSPPDAWGGRALVDFAERLAASPGFDPEALHLLELSALLDAIYERGHGRRTP